MVPEYWTVNQGASPSFEGIRVWQSAGISQIILGPRLRWKRQTIDAVADAFSGGDKLAGQSEAEAKNLHAKIGRLAVENNFTPKG